MNLILAVFLSQFVFADTYDIQDLFGRDGLAFRPNGVVRMDPSAWNKKFTGQVFAFDSIRDEAHVRISTGANKAMERMSSSYGKTFFSTAEMNGTNITSFSSCKPTGKNSEVKCVTVTRALCDTISDAFGSLGKAQDKINSCLKGINQVSFLAYGSHMEESDQKALFDAEARNLSYASNSDFGHDKMNSGKFTSETKAIVGANDMASKVSDHLQAVSDIAYYCHRYKIGNPGDDDQPSVSVKVEDQPVQESKTNR